MKRKEETTNIWSSDTLEDAKKNAIKIMRAYKIPYATIWKTGNMYGFNFDNKPVGFTIVDCGVKREVVEIVYY